MKCCKVCKKLDNTFCCKACGRRSKKCCGRQKLNHRTKIQPNSKARKMVEGTVDSVGKEKANDMIDKAANSVENRVKSMTKSGETEDMPKDPTKVVPKNLNSMGSNLEKQADEVKQDEAKQEEDKREAAPSTEGEDVAMPTEEETAAPAEEKSASPPTLGEEVAAPAEEKSASPPTLGEDVAVPTEEESVAPAKDESVAPAEEESAPSAKEETAALEEKEHTVVVVEEEAAASAEEEASNTAGDTGAEMNKKEDEAREGSTTETKKNLFGTDVENSEGAFADF